MTPKLTVLHVGVIYCKSLVRATGGATQLEYFRDIERVVGLSEKLVRVEALSRNNSYIFHSQM